MAESIAGRVHDPVRFAWTALLIVAATIGTTGCRTTSPMAPVDFSQPGWTVHRGQALWQPKASAPELAGTLLMATSASGGDFVRFSKEPMEMVLARCDSDGWMLHLALVNKSWSGRGQPPRRSSWFQLANAVFHGAPSGDWDWSREGNRWQLTHHKTGERIEGFFSE